MKKKILITILLLLSQIQASISQSQNILVADTEKPKVEETMKTSYYVEPGTTGTRRESDPPSYVRNLSKTGIKGSEKIDWFDVGLDFRSRFEVRRNDIRRPYLATDYPILLRTRAFLGIKNIIDPLRFAVEFEDAFKVNSQFPSDTKDFNRAEIIQGYAELYFKNALGKDNLGNNRPFSIRFGRQAFEFIDRRLIANNQWRNTTNNFLGFRATLGQEKNDWQVDLLALRPINIMIDKWDNPDKDRDFWAAIGHWRKWSEIITLETYYLGLNQRPSAANNNRERQIHSPGLRVYGWLPAGHINYDVTGTYQFGEDNNLTHNAYAVTAEIGYLIKELSWKPRFSLFYGFVTGDNNPTDNESNRFERFFGFGRPWSSDDYVIMENIVTPKIKVEFEPIKGLRVDGGYSFYWLASDTDRFNNLLGGSNNRDVTGNSGTSLGNGLDIRFRFSPTKFMAANLGYAHFINGEFVINRQEAALDESSNSSDFAYIELTFNVVDIFK